MEFKEAFAHSSILNQVCLLSLDDDAKPPKKTTNDTKENNPADTITSQTNIRNEVISDEKDISDKLCQINLNKDNAKANVPHINKNCNNNKDITIDNKFKQDPIFDNDTDEYENMLVGKFVLSLRLDNIKQPKEQNNLLDSSVINSENNINNAQTPDKNNVFIKPDEDSNENDKNQSNGNKFIIPHNFEIRPAIADGNCFFDSFKQGLEQLSVTTTIDGLRFKCKEFAETSPPEWFITALENSFHLSGIRRETVPQYIENIQRYERWGDPDVEGRILCEYFKVSMYLIERQQTENEEVYTSQIINAHGCKCVTNVDYSRDNTIYIVNNGQGHFEPILRIVNQNYPYTASNLSQTSYGKFKIKSQSKHTKQAISCKSKGHLKAVETFNKLESAIKLGDIENLNNLIQSLYQTADKSLLADIYNDKSNTIRETHLITISCKYNQPKVLDFLLHKSNILCYLPSKGPIVDRAYEEALCFVMKLYDVHMLESLYDYWCGDVHWLGCGDNSDIDNVNISNLKRLHVLMINARDKCFIELVKYQQMLVDVHCFISFNAFQIKLYTELSKLKTQSKKNNFQNDTDLRKTEVESLINVLMTAFSIYENYSYKNIRLTKDLKQDQIALEKLFKEDSLYMKYWSYLMYEIYYRKLDYSIALLIINNLHLLKLRLKMPDDTYQDIEATLYYYLYRVNEDWKLYLPEDRPKFYDSALALDNDGLIQPVKLLYDPHRVYNGPVIYLERRKFKKSLNKFKEALENIDSEHLRPEGTKLSKEEINNLSLLPYLRDDYSLKKILQYLDQLSYLDMTNEKFNTMIIIQRILQITGEFIKSTKESCHLSPNTLALIQAEIPKTTYKHIFDIRDDLSHARDGKLIKRIDLENSEHPVYSQILDDLKEIKKAFIKVIDIYKPLLERTLIRLGLTLISERLDELPEQTVFYRSTIEVINESFEVCGHVAYISMENSFINKHWKPLGFTRQLFREIACLIKNSNDLFEQWNIRHKEGVKKVENKLPAYIFYIQQKIDSIAEDNKNWQTIKNDLNQIMSDSTLSISDYPNTTSIKNVKTEIKTVLKRRNDKTKTLKNRIDSLKDWTVEWIQIKELINFMVKKMAIFESHHWEIKRSVFTNQCNVIMNSVPDDNGIENVLLLLKFTRAHFNISACVQPNEQSYVYDGIEAMANLLKQSKFFCTYKEINYLKNNTLNFTCDCRPNRCKHKNILEKLYNNNIIDEKEYETMSSLADINSKCKSIIKNLTNGSGRDNNMLECLVNRVNILYNLFEGEKDLKILILRYKHDAKFRIAFEIIVSDIMNILTESWLLALVNTSYTKLLAEYPLRNLLEHGNPLLDVGSAAFDDNDFPNALINFALDLLDDKSHLNDLMELYEDGIYRAVVLADSSDDLNPKQNVLVSDFKTSSKWKYYVKLLPMKS